MKNNTTISVHCPICGHHLAGYGVADDADVCINAYCPLCDKNYIFNTYKNKSDGDNGNDTNN